MKPTWLFLTLCCAAGAPGPQAPQQPSTFTSQVTLVPVDVRVLDSRGQPITNLSRDDFTVLENDVPQQISHVYFQTLSAREASAPAPPFVGEVPSTAPQTARVFPSSSAGDVIPGPRTTWMPPMGWADQTSQRLSALTGGLSSIVRTGTSAFRRIDEITRASYQIGYYPTNPEMDFPSTRRCRSKAKCGS